MENDVASTLPSMKATENKGLRKQDLATLDINKLHPLSPEVISRQATINIGTIGHVAHGKSTFVKALSGVNTVRFESEKERNITIKLGYANAKVFKATDPNAKRPNLYYAFGSSKEDHPKIPGSEYPLELVRHVSFVDCPGHDILMATMLNGVAVMDAALLLVAANEPCPQPQTSEHLAAVDIMRLKHVIILQNKIDLVDEAAAKAQYQDIRNFIKGTVAEGAPVIPICGQKRLNVDLVAEYIVKKIPVPVRDFTSSPHMIVIRSFDVNKPGEEPRNLRGGVAGGTIVRGVLKVGQEIEVRPGVVSRDEKGRFKCVPIRSPIVSLFAEANELQYAVPGGLIGVGTLIDPSLTRADRLVGQVLGEAGTLPEIYTSLEVNYFLLRQLIGVRAVGDGQSGRVERLAPGEMLMLNVGSTATGGRIVDLGKSDTKTARIELTLPVCTSVGEKVALSRRVERNWRLIGWGTIRSGTALEPSTDV